MVPPHFASTRSLLGPDYGGRPAGLSGSRTVVPRSSEVSFTGTEGHLHSNRWLSRLRRPRYSSSSTPIPAAYRAKPARPDADATTDDSPISTHTHTHTSKGPTRSAPRHRRPLLVTSRPRPPPQRPRPDLDPMRAGAGPDNHGPFRSIDRMLSREADAPEISCDRATNTFGATGHRGPDFGDAVTYVSPGSPKSAVAPGSTPRGLVRQSPCDSVARGPVEPIIAAASAGARLIRSPWRLLGCPLEPKAARAAPRLRRKGLPGRPSLPALATNPYERDILPFGTGNRRRRRAFSPTTETLAQLASSKTKPHWCPTSASDASRPDPVALSARENADWGSIAPRCTAMNAVRTSPAPRICNTSDMEITSTCTVVRPGTVHPRPGRSTVGRHREDTDSSQSRP